MTHQPSEFTEALATVLRDLRAQCPIRPDIREEDDYPGVMLFAPDGSGHGVYAEPDERRPAMLLAEVADQVQGWAVEALRAVWPRCREHPDRHPMTATVEKAAAVWVCPRSGIVACRVGELASGG